MKIFVSPTSPYVRKCLVVAHELGLTDRLQLVRAQAHPIQRDRTLVALNPLAKVPTFIANDGQVLYDSRVICEYLNDMGDGDLLPAIGAERWEILALQALGDGILDAALLVRYEDSARPESLRWPEWRAGQLDKIETCLQYLEGHQSLLERINLGTISVGCSLWYLDLRFSEIAWRSRFAGLAHWYSAFSERQSMRAQCDI